MEIPAGIAPSRERYGFGHRPVYDAHIDAAGRLHLRRRGAKTIVECRGSRWEWATTVVVPQSVLEANQRARNSAPSRAPMGDRTACWQKVADGIPFEMYQDLVPHEHRDDVEEIDKRLTKLLNSSDYRAFRTDSDHRRL